jgi:hypothetical protein
MSLDSLLRKKLTSPLVDYRAKDYIQNYSIKRFVSSHGDRLDSQTYLDVTEAIISRTRDYLLSLPLLKLDNEKFYYAGKIFIHKRWSDYITNLYLSRIYLNSLDKKEKDAIANSVLVDGDYFLDPRMLKKGRLNAFSGVSSHFINKVPSSNTLSIEDLTVLVVDDIIAHGYQSEDGYIDRLNKAVDAKIARKKSSEMDFLNRVFSITPTKVLKRLHQDISPLDNAKRSSTFGKFILRKPDIEELAIQFFIEKYISDTLKIELSKLNKKKQHALLKASVTNCIPSPSQKDIMYTFRHQFHDYLKQLLKRYSFPFPIGSILHLAQQEKQNDAFVLSDAEKKMFHNPYTNHLKKIHRLKPYSLFLNNIVTQYYPDDILEKDTKSLVLSFGKMNIKPAVPVTLFLSAMNAGVTASRAKKITAQVFTSFLNAFVNTADGDKQIFEERGKHNILQSYAPKIIEFYSQWRGNDHKQINKLTDLLVTTIGGAQGKEREAFKYVGTLLECAEKPHLVNIDELRSLKGLRGMLQQDPVAEGKIKRLLLKHDAWRVSDPDDFCHLAKQRLSLSKVEKYLAALDEPKKADIPSLSEPLTRTLGPITLSLLPANYLEGHLGVAVPGVCIEFNKPYHKQQNHEAALNLIVRDGNDILLWGLLLREQKSASPVYFLNNLQGSFPSAYAKHKDAIRDEIIALFGDLGEVLTRSHYFNAISLVDEDVHLPLAIGRNIVVPKMRLDIRYNTTKEDEELACLFNDDLFSISNNGNNS